MDLVADMEGMLMAGAMATALTGSGFSYAWIAAGGGYGARAIGEMMTGVAGLKREQTNDLLQRILAEVPPAAKDALANSADIQFPDLYHLDTCQPKDFFKKNIHDAMDRLATLGMALG